MKIKGDINVRVENPNSRISFEKTGRGSWEVWDRFIAIDKQNLYHIGNICETCKFFFNKQEASLEENFNKTILIDELNSGKLDFSKVAIDDLCKIVPNGNYLVLNSQIKPKIATHHTENDYFFNEQRLTWWDQNEEQHEIASLDFKSYYREPLVDFGNLKYKHKHAFFNFFIPLYDTSQLNRNRVEYYKEQIKNGVEPIALAIGVLDVKTSENYPINDGIKIKPKFGTHWCLAHYIIDGHHKLMAANEMNESLGLISFISRDESWKMIDEMITILNNEKPMSKRKWRYW